MAAKTPCSESNEVNYEKKEYLRLVNYNFHSKNVFFQHPRTRSDISAIISQVKSKTSDLNANNNENYEVIKNNGEDILITKRENHDSPIIQILSVEDCFEAIMEIHKDGHVDIVDISEVLTKKYSFPPICLSMVLQCCRYCNNLEPNQKADLYVTEMLHEISKNITVFYGCVLIYIDKATNFTLLRPLMKKTDLEVSFELYKIFAEFGPPKTLEINTYNENMSCEVDKLLMEMCPQFSVHIEMKPPTRALAILITNCIKKALIDWMEEMQNGNWEVGCYILQRKINTNPNLKQRNTNSCVPPQNVYFAKQDPTSENKLNQGNTNVDDSKHRGVENDLENTMIVTENIDLEQGAVTNSEPTKLLPEPVILNEDSSDVVFTASTASTAKNTNSHKNIASIEAGSKLLVNIHQTPGGDNQNIPKLVPSSKDLAKSNEDSKILAPEGIFLVEDDYSVYEACTQKTTNQAALTVSTPKTPVNLPTRIHQLSDIESSLENPDHNPLEENVIDASKDDEDDIDFGASI